MLDDQTMRIALGAVSLTVIVLFYLGVYRPTRSSFSGWWSLSLLTAGTATALLLFNDSAVRVVTYPVSTALAAAGATCVWFAMRSLRSRRLPRWLLAAGPLAMLVHATTEPHHDSAMATTGPVSFYMALMFIVAAVEAWRSWRARHTSDDGEPRREALVALIVIALAATALAAFYSLRCVVLVVAGQDSSVFTLAAGSGAEDVTLLVCMVAVTFGVSAVGWDQQTRELRRQAMQDDLTGLLGRASFRAHAERALATARSGGKPVLLVIADLDHFKDVNDVHGHATGDDALVAFAAVVTRHLRREERAGRLGGEEFGLVLDGGDEADAVARMGAIAEEFASRSDGFGFDLPTVSYGIAGPDDGETTAQIFERADLAMYVAKSDGRNRAVRYNPTIGREAGRALRRRETDREESFESS